MVQQGLGRRSGKEPDFWFYLDIDAIDPIDMPAVHFSEPGGLLLNEVKTLIEAVMTTGKVLGLSVACYNSGVDPGGSSADKFVRLLSEGLA